MRKGTRSLIITVGGGLVVFLLLAGFLAGLRNTRPTVVAAKPIPAGARLTAEVLEVKEIHSADRLPGALSSIDEAVGQVLTVARAPGDQISSDMLGDQATVGIASQLDPGHRAVAIHVNQASGLVGIIRPGDRVSVVAIIDPQQAGVEFLVRQPLGETSEITPTVPSPVAYIAVTGLRVLLVPQSFRYEEVLPEEDSTGLLAVARTTASAQQESVVLLDVPVEPVEIAPDIRVSPAALLPLLDAKAQIYLLLEPMEKDTVQISVGANLGELYQAVLSH